MSVGCSRPLSRSQTTTPPTPPPTNQASFNEGGPEQPAHTPTPEGVSACGLIPQDPTACHDPPPTSDPSRFHTHTTNVRVVLRTNHQPGSSHSSTIPLVRHHHTHPYIRWVSGCVLLRKEVIQPHLPVRLPCYDFVPIASPTFDGSLHKGWATGFGCCRLS